MFQLLTSDVPNPPKPPISDKMRPSVTKINIFVYLSHKIMIRIPAILAKFKTQLWYAFFAPGFFMFFCSVYQPFGMRQLLNNGGDDFFLNVVLMMCILMGALFLTRTAFYLINRKQRSNWWQWAAWVLLEMTVCTYWLALFVKLRVPDAGQYFEIVAVCLQYTFLVLCYPYFGITISAVVEDKSQHPAPVRDATSIMHFTDSRKQVKFSVAKDSVLFIAAEENYIKIHYCDGSIVKDYTLRASMSSIAPLADKFGLFRCHRSYYINPMHIKAVRRDKSELITAEIDMEGLSVPVSRLKFRELTQLL